MSLTTTDQIRELLRIGLRDGELTLGQRLPTERSLAERLAVTRAAVRQALTVLEAEGWIYRRAGSGTYLTAAESNGDLAPFSRSANVMTMVLASTPSKILEARIALEVKLAELAALAATEQDLGDMRRHCEELSAVLDLESLEFHDRMFHRAIAIATHNDLLLGCFDLLNAARDNPEWHRLKSLCYSITPDRRDAAACEHLAIVEAIAGRNVEQAAAMTLQHFFQIRMSLLGY